MRGLRGAWVIAIPVAAGALSACALLEGLGDLQIVDDAGPSASDGASDVSSEASDAGPRDAMIDTSPGDDGGNLPDVAPNRCPSGRGPAMIEIPTIDGRSFCIDATEVTQAQYKAFLAATAADASGQDPRCTWNATYAPQCDYAPDTNPNHPVSCIDWCDAFAFCAWAGKRMCGQIGGGSLPGFFGSVFDPNKSQWHAACTHNGERAYPYGNDYDGGACNGRDHDAGGSIVVGSLSTCVGGFAGIVDMSGNVGEYEDACDESDAGGRQGVCHARGGNFGDDSNGVKCDSNGVFLILGRDSTDHTIGVRCCAD